MKKRIEELEKEAKKLEPGLKERVNMTAKVMHYGQSFLEDLENKKAFVETDDKAAKILEHPLSEEPSDLKDILKLIENEVDTSGLNPA